MLSHPHWSSDVVERIALSADLGRLAAGMLGVRRIPAALGDVLHLQIRRDPQQERDKMASGHDLLAVPERPGVPSPFGWASTSCSPLTEGAPSSCSEATGSRRPASATMRISKVTMAIPPRGPPGIISAHHCLTEHTSQRAQQVGERGGSLMTLHYMDADLHYVPGTPSDNPHQRVTDYSSQQ